jgi:four helix bundle protein
MSNVKIPMTNDEAQTDAHDGESQAPVFDLQERTARFAEHVIEFARTVRLDPISIPIVKQLVRSSTSIGANYCEADTSGSRKEFRYRISLCQRESKETQYWLRMIGKACPEHLESARIYWKEAMELTKIFSSIYRKTPESRI